MGIQPKHGPKVTLAPARAGDAEALTAISRRAFEDDATTYRGVPGGPPGYDSVDWQREQIERGGYFKILAGKRLVGGAIVTFIEPGVVELSRLYVATEAQNRGIGRRAVELLHRRVPPSVWLLDTPEWAIRNHHFYESLGYRRVGTAPHEDFNLVIYERKGAT